MNRLHRYKTPLLTTLLVTTFLVLPHLALAAGPGAVEGFFQDLLWTILVTITGTILWICAMLFDFSVNTFVIGFGNLFLGSGIGVAVDRIWFILRDFVNMFFIFGLVYIGFKLILDVDNSNTRRWLVNLIIAAILINFSLLITKTVVDFSNQLATQIAISGFGAEPITNEWGATYKTNLADNILGLMGIKDLLSLKLDSSGGGGWGYIFGTAIFFLVTAFVLAAGAFLLMIRFIALTMFMLVSPLMFVSWVLPPVSDTMQRYWKAFIGRAFFAPIYFLFLYFSLETLVGLQESLKVSSGGGKWAKTFSTAATDATSGSTLAASQTTLPYFFIMCGFMIASLMIANKLGADGAKGAMSMGNSLKNKAISYTKKGAGSVTLGAGAKLTQGTVGLGARKLANSKSLNDWAGKSKWGERAMRAARTTADTSFDVRQVGGLGKTLGIGEGKKGGYDTRVKNRQKRDEEFMKSLKTDIPVEETEARKTQIKSEANHELDVIESMAENDGKTTVALTTEISGLGKEIDELSKALTTKVEAGTITSREREQEEQKIANLSATQKRKELARQEMQAQKTLQGQITLNGLRASEATDPAEAARFREEKQRAQEELAKRANMTARKRSAEYRKEEKNVDNEVANVENKIRYANQAAYLKRRTKEASRIPGRTFGEPLAAESVSNLKKKFGRNIGEMAKKDHENKVKGDLAKQLNELAKEQGGGEKKEAKAATDGGH